MAAPPAVWMPPEFREAVLVEGGAHLLHEGHEAVHVVEGEQALAEDFADGEQVAHVGPGEVPAAVAVASLLDGGEVPGKAAGLDLERAVPRERGTVARMAGGHDAVEHVDPARDGLDDLDPVSDPHQVAGSFERKRGDAILHALQQRVLGLSDADAADRISVEADFDETACATLPEIPVDPSLDDAEKELAGSPRLCRTKRGP